MVYLSNWYHFQLPQLKLRELKKYISGFELADKNDPILCIINLFVMRIFR